MQRAANLPSATIPWSRIETMLPARTVTGDGQTEQLHAASMRILAEIGIVSMDDESLGLWEATARRWIAARKTCASISTVDHAAVIHRERLYRIGTG